MTSIEIFAQLTLFERILVYVSSGATSACLLFSILFILKSTKYQFIFTNTLGSLTLNCYVTLLQLYFWLLMHHSVLIALISLHNENTEKVIPKYSFPDVVKLCCFSLDISNYSLECFEFFPFNHFYIYVFEFITSLRFHYSLQFTSDISFQGESSIKANSTCILNSLSINCN